MKVDHGEPPNPFGRHVKCSKFYPNLLKNEVAKKAWKYVYFTCFGTEKYVPCTEMYVPGTGYTLGYVQSTYFVRVLCVFCTYFGVRLG